MKLIEHIVTHITQFANANKSEELIYVRATELNTEEEEEEEVVVVVVVVGVGGGGGGGGEKEKQEEEEKCFVSSHVYVKQDWHNS